MAFGSLWLLTMIRDTLFDMTDTIERSIAAEDFDSAYQTAEELMTYWKKHYNTLALFFRRHQLDELTESITRLPSFILYQELPEIHVESIRIREMILTLHECEMPYLYSIF